MASARRDDARAIGLWTRLVEQYTAAPEAPEADLEWARTLERRGDRAAATARYEHLILTWPDSALVPQARQALDRLRALAFTAELPISRITGITRRLVSRVLMNTPIQSVPIGLIREIREFCRRLFRRREPARAASYGVQRTAYSVRVLFVAALCCAAPLRAQHLLLPMDDARANHLKAYGVTFNALTEGVRAEWFINYRGGAFLLPDVPFVRRRASLDGVTFEAVSDVTLNGIRGEIANSNADAVPLEKAPRIAVILLRTRHRGMTR